MGEIKSGGHAIAVVAMLGATLGGLFVSGITLGVFFLWFAPPELPIDETVKTEQSETTPEEQRDEQKAEPPTSVLPTPGAGPQNEPQNPAVSDQASGQKNANTLPVVAPWPPLWHLIGDLFFAGCLVLLAVAQYWVGKRQWQAMREQNEIMTRQMAQTDEQLRIAQASAEAAQKTVEQMHSGQRAWIGYEEIGILKSGDSPAVAPNKEIKCSLWVKNWGSTPGTILKNLTTYIVCSQNMIGTRLREMEAEFEKWPELRTVLAPGTDVSGQTINPTPIGDALFSRITSGADYFLIVGRLTYVDIEGRQHDTQACYEYRPSTGKFQRHGKHNHMT